MIKIMAGQLDNMSEQDLQDIASYYAAQTMSGDAAKHELVDLGVSIYRAEIALIILSSSLASSKRANAITTPMP